eukprot:250968_1
MGVCQSNKNRGPENVRNNLPVLTRRSSINRFGLIVIAFIRQKLSVSTNMHSLPSRVQHLCTLYFGSLNGDLIIKANQTLKLNDLKQKIFEYNSIIIRKNATLTLNRYNPNTKNGGTLSILCKGNLYMESGAKITMSGRGYHGGHHGRNGASYIQKTNAKKMDLKTRKPFIGGGGAGQISIATENGAENSMGAGGGYGSKGINGTGALHGYGGLIYGNNTLSVLHLGSGGGSGYYFDEMSNTLRSHKGGSGGGAIKIKCLGNIIMENKSKILCNGNKGKGSMSGGGSGGSIHLICKNKSNLQLDNDACIEAIGGVNGSGGDNGNGGNGRIRIQYIGSDVENNINMDYDNIKPQPYIG